MHAVTGALAVCSEGIVNAVKQRIITAAVGIAICVVLLIFGQIYPLVIAIAMGVVAAAMISEFLLAKDLLKNYSISLLCLAFAVLMPVAVNYSLQYITLYVYSVLIFAVMIIRHESIMFDKIAFAYSGTILITLSLSCISVLSYASYSIYYIVLALAVPWTADAGAYFIGTFFGKHKLCPNISPKKTVEGAVGGLVFGVLSGVIVSLVFQYLLYEFVDVNYLTVIVLCFAISILSIVGDLAFSLVKRSCGIKDFGSIMPGHGGFCDRFDSVIFTAPLIMIVSCVFPPIYAAVCI